MGEFSGAAGLSDVEQTAGGDVASAVEGVVTEQSPSQVSDDELYQNLKRLHIMGAELGVVSANTRDGRYAGWSFAAFTAASIMRKILEDRGSPLLEKLREEEALEPRRAGVKSLPLR
jgi:hypothetical protein